MSGWMTAIRGVFEIEGVNPRNGRGKTAEVEMIFNRKMIAALRVDGTDVLFDFLESAFDFPSCGIEFDHPLGSECQVTGYQRERKALVIFVEFYLRLLCCWIKGHEHIIRDFPCKS